MSEPAAQHQEHWYVWADGTMFHGCTHGASQAWPCPLAGGADGEAALDVTATVLCDACESPGATPCCWAHSATMCDRCYRREHPAEHAKPSGGADGEALADLVFTDVPDTAAPYRDAYTGRTGLMSEVARGSITQEVAEQMAMQGQIQMVNPSAYRDRECLNCFHPGRVHTGNTCRATEVHPGWTAPCWCDRFQIIV